MSTTTSRAKKLEDKRQRFEEAGRFPTKTVVIAVAVVIAAIVGGLVYYQQYVKSPEVGGLPIASKVSYPSDGAEMVALDTAQQTTEGLLLPVADVQTNYIVGLTYQRETPMPGELQQVTGGDNLPLVAYTAPNGNLVVATALCEPCRSTEFHIEGNNLVCNTCYTKWDLNTLTGVEGGCLAFPPEAVTTEMRGDQVFVPKAELEAWAPRAF